MPSANSGLRPHNDLSIFSIGTNYSDDPIRNIVSEWDMQFTEVSNATPIGNSLDHAGMLGEGVSLPESTSTFVTSRTGVGMVLALWTESWLSAMEPIVRRNAGAIWTTYFRWRYSAVHEQSFPGRRRAYRRLSTGRFTGLGPIYTHD